MDARIIIKHYNLNYHTYRFWGFGVLGFWLRLLLLHHTNEGLVGLVMELRPLQDLVVGQRDLHLEVVGLIVQKAEIGNLLRLRCL